ncbi:MAG TPA: hypothetical protein VNN55_11490 [bacterium]|nr:hypothetical protein [bacterium]
MIRTLSRCGSALGLVFLLLATPVLAFEPMPPIMQTLLEVFPEENGRFVDEPFGATSEMPAEARPFFETFRVVVPSVDDIEKTLARLFAASSRLPIKKITRYDRSPGAPGLPGFRGVWCQTEDESQIGFSIVTINENRFLIWAKMGYYPFFANDSVNPKVRDQYARDVSQYLAGLDLKVPDNEVPPASGRGLPEGMDFLEPTPAPWVGGGASPSLLVPQIEEIRTWGLSSVKAVVPAQSLMERIINDTKDTLYANRDESLIQRQFERWLSPAFRLGASITNVTSGLFDTLRHGGNYSFVIDRHGRMRICTFPGEGDDGIPDILLFPMAPATCAGVVSIRRGTEWASPDPPEVASVVCNFSSYFWAGSMWSEQADAARAVTDLQLQSFGQFFRAMQLFGVGFDNVIIRKHDLFW